ncbi:MAG: ATPase, T2SS/T4P/T4SS family [Isosphaeraceae bacterium]
MGFTRHILEHLINFDQLIKFAVEQNASDLHFQTGAAPLLRINGQMRNVESPPLTNEVMRQFILSLRPKMTADELDLQLVQGLDFSYYVPGLSRFRVNVYSHLGAPAMVLRVIKPKIRTMEELQLPPVIKDIALSHRGLTLVTGTTGSGKSTTLAAMIDLINNSYRCKIITIEDPVEFMHTNQKALISQVEVGQDTSTFEKGLHQALRQDRDVIFVGELRESEIMRMALRAADTRVREENVHATEFRTADCDCKPDIVRSGHVHRHGPHAKPRGGEARGLTIKQIHLAITQHDRGSLLDEALGRGQSDARGGASDQRDLALETVAHRRDLRQSVRAVRLGGEPTCSA